MKVFINSINAAFPYERRSIRIFFGKLIFLFRSYLRYFLLDCDAYCFFRQGKVCSIELVKKIIWLHLQFLEKICVEVGRFSENGKSRNFRFVFISTKQFISFTKYTLNCTTRLKQKVIVARFLFQVLKIFLWGSKVSKISKSHFFSFLTSFFQVLINL